MVAISKRTRSTFVYLLNSKVILPFPVEDLELILVNPLTTLKPPSKIFVTSLSVVYADAFTQL